LSYAHAPLEATFGKRKIRCLLAHDHVLLRQGLRRLLEDEPDLDVVAEAGSAAEALPLILRHMPQVVVTDARAFGLPADELEQLIERACPQSKVVFLSPKKVADPSGEARATRQTSAKDLAEMIRAACSRGKTEARAAPREIPRLSVGAPPLAQASRKILTERERQVVQLLAEGETVRSAAAILGLSVKTVDAHKFNLMRKLGLHNKAELVMWAIQKRIVKLPVNF